MTTSGVCLQRLQDRVGLLPEGLQAHIYRVRDIAFELSSRHHVDIQRTELAVLGHDVARALKGEELLRRAVAAGITAGKLERRAPVLLHGPVGAESLRREDDIDDEELLEAVRWHSTGHPELGPLGKVIFIADKLDPRKSGSYPYQTELRRMAEEDLDIALLEFLCREAEGRLRRREPVHPLSLETINALLVDGGGAVVR